jgi:hypothetical protein
MEMQSNSLLLHLPSELICYIGDFLGAEKIPLSMTCKRLNQVLKTDVKKIKKQIRACKDFVAFELKLRDNERSVILLRSTDITISTLPFSGIGCLKRYMYKLIKTKPGLTYIDEDGETYEYDSRTVRRFLTLFVELVSCSAYDTLISYKICHSAYSLMRNYKCSWKNFEKVVNILKHYHFVLENWKL